MVARIVSVDIVVTTITTATSVTASTTTVSVAAPRKNKRRRFQITVKGKQKRGRLVNKFNVRWSSSCNKSTITCFYSTTSKVYLIRSFCSCFFSLICGLLLITTQSERGDTGRWEWWATWSSAYRRFRWRCGCNNRRVVGWCTLCTLPSSLMFAHSLTQGNKNSKNLSCSLFVKWYVQILWSLEYH